MLHKCHIDQRFMRDCMCVNGFIIPTHLAIFKDVNALATGNSSRGHPGGMGGGLVLEEIHLNIF
jgi:hypothetical protein